MNIAFRHIFCPLSLLALLVSVASGPSDPHQSLGPLDASDPPTAELTLAQPAPGSPAQPSGTAAANPTARGSSPKRLSVSNASAWAHTGVPTSVYDRIDRYLAGLVGATPVDWDLSCPYATICGITDVASYPPSIHLDPYLAYDYTSSAGVFVLTHEAAHARSIYFYGSVERLYAVSEALMIDGRSGQAAVEFMADCATIVKLGYSEPGSYTQACTRAQYREAAKYWQ